MSGLPSWKTIDPAERDRLLADLCAAGLTASQIAGRFTDCSRSAAIGRLRRLNLALKRPYGTNRFTTKAAKPQPPAPISAKESRKRGAQGGIPSRSLKEARDAKLNLNSSNIRHKAESRKSDPGLPIVITTSAAWDALPSVEPITIDQLNSRTCRWPLWEEPSDPRLFCGAECDAERVYCRPHGKLSYIPATVRQRASLRSAERIS